MRNWLVRKNIWRYIRGVVITGLDCSYNDVSKALRSSERSVFICQSTRRCITSELNVQQHCCKNRNLTSNPFLLSARLLSHDSATKAHINTQHGILQHFPSFFPVLHSTAFSQIPLGCALNSCLPEAQDNSKINKHIKFKFVFLSLMWITNCCTEGN